MTTINYSGGTGGSRTIDSRPFNSQSTVQAMGNAASPKAVPVDDEIDDTIEHCTGTRWQIKPPKL